MGDLIVFGIGLAIILGWGGMWNLIEIIFTPIINLVLELKDIFTKQSSLGEPKGSLFKCVWLGAVGRHAELSAPSNLHINLGESLCNLPIAIVLKLWYSIGTVKKERK